MTDLPPLTGPALEAVRYIEHDATSSRLMHAGYEKVADARVFGTYEPGEALKTMEDVVQTCVPRLSSDADVRAAAGQLLEDGEEVIGSFIAEKDPWLGAAIGAGAEPLLSPTQSTGGPVL